MVTFEVAMGDKTAIQEEVDQNYEAFKKILPELAKAHMGKYALMRRKEFVQVFDSPRDAIVFAEAQYPDGLFSVQQVTSQVADLGYFSHAVHIGSV